MGGNQDCHWVRVKIRVDFCSEVETNPPTTAKSPRMGGGQKNSPETLNKKTRGEVNEILWENEVQTHTYTRTPMAGQVYLFGIQRRILRFASTTRPLGA